MPRFNKKINNRTKPSRKISPSSSSNSLEEYDINLTKDEVVNKLKDNGYIVFTGNIGLGEKRPDGSIKKDLSRTFKKDFRNLPIKDYPIDTKTHNSILMKVHPDHGNLMVLDFDIHCLDTTKEKIKQVVDIFKLRKVWIDYTMNGGCHIYMKRPEALQSMRNKTINYHGVAVDILLDKNVIVGGSVIGKYSYDWSYLNPWTVKDLDYPPEDLVEFLLSFTDEQLNKTTENTAEVEPLDITDFNDKEKECWELLETLPVDIDLWSMDSNFFKMGCWIAKMTKKSTQGLNMWIHWAKVLPNKNEISEYKSRWRSIRITDSPSKNWIYKFLNIKMDGLTPDEYQRLLDTISEERFTNMISWGDFEDKYNKSIAKTYDEALELCRAWMGAFVYNRGGFGTFCTRDDDGNIHQQKIGTKSQLGKLMIFTADIMLLDSTGRPADSLTLSASGVIENAIPKVLMNSINKVIYRPPTKTIPSKSINLCYGNKAKIIPMEEVAMDYVEVINNHIYRVLCNENKNYYKWLMAWFYQTIILMDKVRTVPVFIDTNKGTGKGTILDDFILQMIIGDEEGEQMSLTKKHTRSFNGETIRRRMLVYNESPAGLNQANSLWEDLKSEITDKKREIHKKFCDAFNIENWTNFIICMNTQLGIKMETDCRRYVPIETGSYFMRKPKYFNFIHDVIRNQHNANSWYSWLASKKELEYVVLDDIVHTDMRESIIITSMSSAQKYAFDIEQMGDIPNSEFTNKDTDKEGNKWVSTNDLYSNYTSYCVAHGYTKVSHSNFTTYIKKFIITKSPKNKLFFNISKVSISQHITMPVPHDLALLPFDTPIQDDYVYDLLV